MSNFHNTLQSFVKSFNGAFTIQTATESLEWGSVCVNANITTKKSPFDIKHGSIRFYVKDDAPQCSVSLSAQTFDSSSEGMIDAIVTKQSLLTLVTSIATSELLKDQLMELVDAEKVKVNSKYQKIVGKFEKSHSLLLEDDALAQIEAIANKVRELHKPKSDGRFIKETTARFTICKIQKNGKITHESCEIRMKKKISYSAGYNRSSKEELIYAMTNGWIAQNEAVSYHA
ncbi:hypothetical protein OTK49_21355 [Vibrio coralliirubri]|uniref:hypothetical protein n=1 Tax=Vibrio coralliirubri TaxID=1516159 RepID=UPI00228341A9|nr:hypothetical protein [Vibrio coralliirubri]MCY9865069.1 hypothetical protein [Vibrio coralliirubri]